jgi:hypothetical protein
MSAINKVNSQPSSAPGSKPKSMAQLLRAITAHHVNSGDHAAQIAAIRRLEHHLTKKLADLEIPIDRLPEWFSDIRGGSNGYTHRGARADLKFIRSAMLAVGVLQIPGARDRMPSEGWARLLAGVDNKVAKDKLMGLARFATLQEIEPHRMSMEILNTYAEALKATCQRVKARETFLVVCRHWNYAADKLDGWPAFRAAPISGYPTRTRPFSDYPPTLILDINELFDVWRRGDHVRAPGKRIAPETEKSIRLQLRGFLDAVCKSGVDFTTLTSLSAAITFENVRRARTFLLRARGNGKTAALYHQFMLLHRLADRWLNSDDETLEQLLTLARQLRPNEIGMGRVNREALLATQEIDAKQLLSISAVVLQRHSNKTALSVSECVEIQVALAFELIIVTGIQPSALAAIKPSDFSETLVGLELTLPRTAKTRHRKVGKRSLTGTCPSLFILYTDTARPRLKRQPNEWLFPGQAGGPKSVAVLCRQICQLINRETNEVLTITQLRQFLAFHHYRSPGNGLVKAQRMLGYEHRVSAQRLFKHLKMDEGCQQVDRLPSISRPLGQNARANRHERAV